MIDFCVSFTTIPSRIRIAKNGKEKYFKLFNEVKISKYIIDKSIGKKASLI